MTSSASRLRALRDEMQRQGRKFVDALAALAPWRGDEDALALVQVPGEAEIAALRRRHSQAIAARQSAIVRLADKTGEAERLKAEAAAAARATELIGDESAADLRAAREAAWSGHRAALSAETADAFEAAMRRDDAAGAARLANARELAARRERIVKLAGVEAECARAGADLDAAERALHALDHEIAALMPAAPPKGRDPLSFLDAWRARREEAMAIVAALRESKEAARRANEDALRACRALSGALKEAGVAHAAEGSLETLIEAAETAIAEQAKGESLRQKARDRRADVVRAEGRLKAALEEDARWRRDWRGACAGSWLGEVEAEPPLNAARQALKALEDLRAALRDCAELDHRIAAMEHDKQLFAANADEIGQLLGVDER